MYITHPWFKFYFVRRSCNDRAEKKVVIEVIIEVQMKEINLQIQYKNSLHQRPPKCRGFLTFQFLGLQKLPKMW